MQTATFSIPPLVPVFAMILTPLAVYKAGVCVYPTLIMKGESLIHAERGECLRSLPVWGEAPWAPHLFHKVVIT